jgi:hypothetical protein
VEQAKIEGKPAVEARKWWCRGLGALAPASSTSYASLLSVHDRCVHNDRRFTLSRAHGLAAGLGFRVLKFSCRKALLVPQMLLNCFVERADAESGVHEDPRELHAAFSAVGQVAIMADRRRAFAGFLVSVAARDG